MRKEQSKQWTEADGNTPKAEKFQLADKVMATVFEITKVFS